MKKLALALLLIVALVFTSCSTFRADYYVEDKFYTTQEADTFADPGEPSLPYSKVFIGWAQDGSDEIVTDWTVPDNKTHRYDAVLEDNVCFYLNGRLWKAIPVSEFADPGEPEEKLIPRGYEFLGWLAEPDYQIFTDWENLPENVLRFDALLVETSVQSDIGAHNVKLNFNPYRQIEVLGPVFISETYEIVDGSVKIGGIGYNDMMKAAVEKYPEADQVIDIVVDYTTERYTIQYDSSGNIIDELSQKYPASVKDVYIRTASYTGLAINIK